MPPSVSVPPGSSLAALLSLMNRVSQNDISGEVHRFAEMRACQNGVAWVDAMAWKARPMIPATDPSRRLLVV